MKDLTIFIEEFMEKTSFPEESKDTFRNINSALLSSSEYSKEFDEIYAVCLEQDFDDIGTHLDKAQLLGDKMGIHEYSIKLFFFIYAAYDLKARYEKEGIDLNIYWDSMCDLRAKLIECHDVYGIWGSFVATWFRGFFNVSRFALGRIQFEETDFGEDQSYIFGDYEVKSGETVINMHIPSLGRLPIESVYDSFKKAYEFYSQFVREDKIMVFVCGSWLLYKENLDFYPKGNLTKFIECFDIIKSHDSETFGDCWRVFGKYKDLPTNELPQDTSLRKAYAERLMSAKPTGGGFGVILFDGEKIVNK